MAIFADTPSTTGRRAFFAGIAARVFDFFEQYMEAQSRSSEVARLQRLSDVQLQELGVERQDIVRYVYRDIYFM